MKKLFLIVDKYKGYGKYYIPLDNSPNWYYILEQIEGVLEDRYLDNEDKLDGIKLSFSIEMVDKEVWSKLLTED